MKNLLLILCLILTTSTYCLANQIGFQDGCSSVLTIFQALKLQDDSYVTIQGNILKRISDDKYIFKDSTGTITVEIDEDKWGGQSVNTNDKLELTGEIEKKFNTTILDVQSVKKLSK